MVITREIGDRNGEAISLGNLGSVSTSLGQYTQAIEYHEQALAITREIGDRNGEAKSLNNLGSAYGSIGDYVKAIDYHEQSLAIQREIGDLGGQAAYGFNLGKALAKVGRIPDALAACRHARQLFADIGLDADVQYCDNVITQLSTVPAQPRTKPRNPLARLWHWFKQCL
ncbi:MAG: tetratricopeptide repeat protein [Acaryochloridaceae cyanobacterium RU_4_10]|nr:tetratricopeptide repeat protein [Acaryochloridaceae cyanobacterium RU_4_10]